jgi:hypothetical protein
MTTLHLLLAVSALVAPPQMTDDPAGQDLRVQPEHDQQEPLPTLQEILDRHIAAVGGRDAIAKLTTRVMKGRLVTDLPTRQPPVHESNGFWVYAKAPGKYLVIQQSAFGTRREGYDGEICWSRAGAEVALDAHYDRRFA